MWTVCGSFHSCLENSHLFYLCDLNSNPFFFLYITFDHFSHWPPFPSNVRAIYNLFTPTLLGLLVFSRCFVWKGFASVRLWYQA